ncbi:hypothetical protein [Actinacidiphila acididurans]|uniref:Uncharacterized protein n=1 Tax=Actinacidiphila acididurans TaxID=2784346 RepID=A0ABS2TYU9_9ACTN|nr:hypothetical protein [Actinacidiphila acididurans]MBM9508514.1 hypothetical protein [Actinacidiphila acididurans]
MNQVARRLGKTLALVLPVVLVLSGTLAVTRVPWVASSSEAQILTASAKSQAEVAANDTTRAPQEVLRRRLLAELQQKDPGTALTGLQVAMAEHPSLARYCSSIARSLGRAAVAKYAGSVRRAQKWSRPVCDTAFATGVASVG